MGRAQEGVRELPTWDPRRFLADPRFYSGVQRSLTRKAMRPEFIRRYAKPQPGERMLDIGCGIADDLVWVPDGVEYVGFDLSEAYVEAARRRWGRRGEFHVGGLELLRSEIGQFDLAIANGVLHHLSDETVAEFFEVVSMVLKTDGRIVTKDPAFVDGQSWIARSLAERDRGEFVRTPNEYRALASGSMKELDSWIRNDLLRLPYTHVIMRCQRQR